MRTQITNLEDLSQLTIVQAFQEGDELWLVFRDKHFAKFEVSSESEGFGYPQLSIHLIGSTVQDTDPTLHALGLITLKEHHDAVKKEEDEYLEYVRLREIKEAERISLLEKAQLETLKKKYE